MATKISNGLPKNGMMKKSSVVKIEIQIVENAPTLEEVISTAGSPVINVEDTARDKGLITSTMMRIVPRERWDASHWLFYVMNGKLWAIWDELMMDYRVPSYRRCWLCGSQIASGEKARIHLMSGDCNTVFLNPYSAK